LKDLLPENPVDPERDATPPRMLISSYLAGDRAAEQSLFHKHSELLLRKVRSHPWMAGLRKHASPEDVVNEVFLRALSSGVLRTLEPRERGALSRVLFKILDRVLTDMYRRHGAAKRDLPMTSTGSDTEGRGVGYWIDGAVPSDATTPTSSARVRELLEICRAHLTEREWEVWRRVEIEGLGAQGAAEALGLSPSAVRSLTFRARAKMLALFDEPSPNEDER